jgi:hypothetical protein
VLLLSDNHIVVAIRRAAAGEMVVENRAAPSVERFTLNCRNTVIQHHARVASLLSLPMVIETKRVKSAGAGMYAAGS